MAPTLKRPGLTVPPGGLKDWNDQARVCLTNRDSAASDSPLMAPHSFATAALARSASFAFT